MKKVAIFGGSQESTYKKIGAKNNIEILFHCGKKRNGGNKKDFNTFIKKADMVVVLLGAVGHVSMDVVKELCKEQNKEIYFAKGFGASGAIQECAARLNGVAA